MFRCASSRQLQLRCYKRKRAPEYCDEIDELHGCKYWRTLVWCCGSVCKVTGARDGCVETTGSVAPWVWGQSLVCPCVATLRRTLITLNPTLRRDTSQYSDTAIQWHKSCGTRHLTLNTHHSQPDTPQRHIPVQWHKRNILWDKRLDTWHLIHSTRHSAETWHLTLSRDTSVLTQHILWDMTRHILWDKTWDTWHLILSSQHSAVTLQYIAIHLTLDTLNPTLRRDTSPYSDTRDMGQDKRQDTY